MDGLAEIIYDGAIRVGEWLPGVIGEQGLLLAREDTCLLEFGEVPAEIGLIELEDCFKVTNAKRLFVKEIQDAKSIRVGERLEDLGYFHEHRVISGMGFVYCRGAAVWPTSVRLDNSPIGC